jgi:hypothetical protein
MFRLPRMAIAASYRLIGRPSIGCAVRQMQWRAMSSIVPPGAGVGTAGAEDTTEKSKEDEYANDVGVSLLVFIAVFATVYFSKESDEFKYIEEQECASKLAADMSSGGCSMPNGGRLTRVKQSWRLSMADLAANGVSHARLEGSIWRDPGGKVYQQTYWNDEAAYRLTADAAVELRNATYELHTMCLEAVDLVAGLCPMRFIHRYKCSILQSFV